MYLPFLPIPALPNRPPRGLIPPLPTCLLPAGTRRGLFGAAMSTLRAYPGIVPRGYRW